MESGFLRASNQRAFSLIEVTMALGIVAFAIIPLLGLLGVGLTTSRANIDRSIMAQILNWVQQDVRWQTNGAAYSAYFNEFGIATTNTQDTAYQASMTPKAASLPGSALSVSNWEVVIWRQPGTNQKLADTIVWSSP